MTESLIATRALPSTLDSRSLDVARMALHETLYRLLDLPEGTDAELDAVSRHWGMTPPMGALVIGDGVLMVDEDTVARNAAVFAVWDAGESSRWPYREQLALTDDGWAVDWLTFLCTACFGSGIADGAFCESCVGRGWGLIGCGPRRYLPGRSHKRSIPAQPVPA